MSLPKWANPDHPIHELFVKRWSPYAFSERPVADEDLRSLFEAARWSVSSYNEQPWHYIVATRADSEEFERLLSCLVEGNQPWAKAAPVLALGCTSLNFARNGQPNTAAEHDLGAASALPDPGGHRPRPVRPPDDRHPARSGPRAVPHPGRLPALDRLSPSASSATRTRCRRSTRSATSRPGSGKRRPSSSSAADGKRHPTS